MNCKAKGTRNEAKSIALLELSGYRCTRSAASLGVFDIVGISASEIILVQVKTGRFPGLSEMQAIRDFPAPSNARKILHRWIDRQPVPDVKEVI